MDRELLIELGCEEIPASWLPSLTQQLGDAVAARLKAARLDVEAPVETYSTPRRLTALCAATRRSLPRCVRHIDRDQEPACRTSARKSSRSSTS